MDCTVDRDTEEKNESPKVPLKVYSGIFSRGANFHVFRGWSENECLNGRGDDVYVGVVSKWHARKSNEMDGFHTQASEKGKVPQLACFESLEVPSRS